MKKIITIIILGIYFLGFSQIESGKVIYEGYINFDMKKSLLSMPDSLPNQKKRVQKIIEGIKPLRYILKFEHFKSEFKQEEALSQENSINLTAAFGAKGDFFFNKKENQLINYKEVFGEKFLVYDNVDSIKWKLVNQTKKINNIVCYKATTTIKLANSRGEFVRKVTAWYAPSIPISFGPENYVNLPGLILEINVNKFTYKAVKIELNNNIKLKKFKKKGKKISRQNFLKMSVEYGKDMGFK